MAGQTLRFKRKFKPLTVEIEGKDEAVYKFQTVPLTRSVETEMIETMETAGEAFAGIAPEDVSLQEALEKAVDLILETIDKLVSPIKGKKTKASKVLRDLWEAEEIESADIRDFLNELGQQRRPT